jgi:hypothetical protein
MIDGARSPIAPGGRESQSSGAWVRPVAVVLVGRSGQRRLHLGKAAETGMAASTTGYPGLTKRISSRVGASMPIEDPLASFQYRCETHRSDASSAESARQRTSMNSSVNVSGSDQ